MSHGEVRPTRLDRPVDSGRDHILGNPTADITLLEFGSYDCPYCHAAHEVIAELRDKFGDRMRYVFRHRPITGSEAARRPPSSPSTRPRHRAVLGGARRADEARAGLQPRRFRRDRRRVRACPRPKRGDDAELNAANKVQADRRALARSGAQFTPTFFINSRRYEGAWDKSALSEAMLGSLGHRIHSATRRLPALGARGRGSAAADVGAGGRDREFAARAGVRGLVGAPFSASRSATAASRMPLRDWINHGLLSVFFLVVGLEIKREFTVGRLQPRRAALPVAAALGGMTVPALIYLLVIPLGPWCRAGACRSRRIRRSPSR